MLTFNCNNATAGASPAYFVATPTVPALPIVVDSPHSGIAYPPDFATVAPDDAIRTTWDAYVDELWAGTPARGGTLLGARFRAHTSIRTARKRTSTQRCSPSRGPSRLRRSRTRSAGWG